MLLVDFITEINKIINMQEFEKQFIWFIRKFSLIDKSKKINDKKSDYLHPLRPRKGDIYLIEFGRNIGSELNDTHMGIIMQESSKNIFSNTVIVVPISSSPKLYDTHEKIINSDIKNGRLDKLPSKAKAEQITCIDKARLVHKIGEVTNDFLRRLEKRILKNLDIK